MNNNNLSQIVQHGFRVAVGAVTSLVETAQNPDKRSEAISELQMELNQKTREWAVKGEITEQEARKILDNLLRQRNGQQNSPDSDRSTNNTGEENINSGLQELKEDLIALRIELAKMRESQK